jgi:hypothetical protein
MSPWETPSGSTASAIGNWNRFVCAPGLPDGAGGVDFHTVFCTSNPFAISTEAPASIVSLSRNDPT